MNRKEQHDLLSRHTCLQIATSLLMIKCVFTSEHSMMRHSRESLIYLHLISDQRYLNSVLAGDLGVADDPKCSKGYGPTSQDVHTKGLWCCIYHDPAYGSQQGNMRWELLAEKFYHVVLFSR